MGLVGRRMAQTSKIVMRAMKKVRRRHWKTRRIRLWRLSPWWPHSLTDMVAEGISEWKFGDCEKIGGEIWRWKRREGVLLFGLGREDPLLLCKERIVRRTRLVWGELINVIM